MVHLYKFMSFLLHFIDAMSFSVTDSIQSTLACSNPTTIQVPIAIKKTNASLNHIIMVVRRQSTILYNASLSSETLKASIEHSTIDKTKSYRVARGSK